MRKDLDLEDKREPGEKWSFVFLHSYILKYRLIKELIEYSYNALFTCLSTWPRSPVGNVSDNRCESDCRSRGHKFDPCPVPYLHGD